jgi:hypothetical protein
VGFEVSNLDSFVTLGTTRLRPYLEQMRVNVADALRVDVTQVSVKARSNDGIGPEGEGRAPGSTVLRVGPPRSRHAALPASRRPKVVVVDTGLAADLCGLGEQAFGPTADGVAAGALFDTFVTNEVLKQATWSERSVDLSYFRDRDGAEVDVIVEVGAHPPVGFGGRRRRTTAEPERTDRLRSARRRDHSPATEFPAEPGHH